MTDHSNAPCIQLIGGLLVNADDPQYRWFGETFHRVTHEVAQTGVVTRLMRFACPHAQFAGVDVECMADIPTGLVAWELCDGNWTIREASGEVIWQAPITWQWRAQSHDGRWVGDFTAPSPEAWGGDLCTWQLTANAYLKPGESATDEILLTDPDPTWAQQYAEFAAWLHDALGPQVARRIEHYGSTAIPGIPAKPIIDVLLEAPSFAVARQRLLPLLNREEWEYWHYHDHLIFIKRQACMGQRTHHLHVAPAGHQLWEGIAFRDYLIAHPDVAARYATLKHELAARYRDDREGYTNAKTEFVQAITAKALRREG